MREWGAGMAEEGWQERTISANTTLQIRNLSERRVLAACAQQVAEGSAVNAAVASLVEELEGFAVVGRGLVLVIHVVPFSKVSSICVRNVAAGPKVVSSEKA